MAHKIGKQTIIIDSAVGIRSSAAVGSKKESEGPLGSSFDIINDDSRFGEKTWEKAESKMQELACWKALKKAEAEMAEVDFLFAGDLLNQCIASAFSARGSKVPFIGLYGACSTFAEGVGLASVFADSAAKNCLAVASSHFCSAERQYRFPLEYGGQRPPSAQWTATAAGAALVSRDSGAPFVKAVTFGTVEDLGINDQNNMGAAMAPAAAATLSQFFRDTYTDPDDYDLILTGDLGAVGAQLMRELMLREGFSLGDNYNDCGLMLYDREIQQVESGASGCGCSASVLSGHILPQMEKGVLKTVLALSTGALMSPTSVQQGETIPGVAHLVCFSNEKGGIF
ncbi:MAG: stage V sporulation protein AD [Oscillospiraceae bacterium]|nr:stage V sporulation protein AD [Oscillospiraceae bacterium]MBQ3499831.1 stage V sporulation protein AD [Oscillospiraceae bacterium]MBQ4643741.1 stage V sporulation protein AD [Oscillospiraceae bacterium]